MKFLMLTLIFIMCSCATHKQDKAKQRFTEQSLLATNWFQTSAEMKALYLQGYNLAKLRLDSALKTKKASKLAIITDIDETIFDNSPYQAKLIKEKEAYPTYWVEWIQAAHAQALPGALDFFTYAASKGVNIFYITNRKDTEKEATLKNLKDLQFPLKDETHLLLKTTTGEKTERRASVAQKYEVILLLGDNLNDFTEAFEKKSVEEKDNIVTSTKNKFGEQFIVFPNPLYGDWENALYNYDFQMSLKKKYQNRVKALRSF